METDRNGMSVLSRRECVERLGRSGIGRIAVTVGALPTILPVNYAVAGGDIYFRTAPGTKLAAATRNAIVAFEVDQVDRLAHTGWSVVAVGPAAEVTDPSEFKRLVPLPVTRWITGGPETLVRIHPELLSGRAVTHLALADTDARTAGWSLAACPACSSDALESVSDGELANLVCTTCLSCWHTELGAVYRIPWATCPGCEIADICRAAHATTRD